MKISELKEFKLFWENFYKECEGKKLPITLDTMYSMLHNTKGKGSHAARPEGIINLIDKDIAKNIEKANKTQQRRIEILKKMEQERREEENRD